MITKYKHLIALGLILLAALFFRLYRLGDNPPSLNWDEISHGYNAYSIIQTGADEWGVRWPLIFRAYGDYKLPLYIYLTAGSEIVFGLTPIAVRLVSVLSGVGLVCITYLIYQTTTGKGRKYALFAALLCAVSPWPLFVSRAALEANLAALLFAGGTLSFLVFVTKRRAGYLVLTSALWGLSLHSYNSARIVVPLVTLFIIIWLGKKRLFKSILIFLFPLLLFSIPVINQIRNTSGSARFLLVSIIDGGLVNRINENRGLTKLPKPLPRLIHNKLTYGSVQIASNYLANLSPQYLFFHGGSNYQFSQPNHELLYLVTAPFLLIGIIFIVTKGSKKERFLLLWLALALVPSAVTRDAPHVLRTLLVLPVPFILTARGVEVVANWLSKNRSRFGGNFLLLILIVSVIISFARWWQDYWAIYRPTYSWAWQDGYRQAVNIIKENYNQYDHIIITKKYGEPHEFILFYYSWPPARYQTDPIKKWDTHNGWYWIDGFDKFIFVNDWEVASITRCPSGRCLLVNSPNNYPAGWILLDQVSNLNGQPLFEIRTYDNKK